MFSGVFSNQADLAPNFAGTLMALTNMLATIPGILVPTLVGIMTHGTNGLAPWHTGETILLKKNQNTIFRTNLISLNNPAVFGMTAGILVFEVVLFSIFGKADIQVGRKINENLIKSMFDFSLSPGTTMKEEEHLEIQSNPVTEF